MGNSETIAKPPNTSLTNTNIPNDKQLIASSFKLYSKDSGLIHSENGSDLFPSLPDYGVLLLEHLSNGGKLTQEEYVEQAEQLVEMTSPQLMEFYFKVFSRKKQHLDKSDVLLLCRVCYHGSCVLGRLAPTVVADDDLCLKSIIKTMFGREDTVSEGDFRSCINARMNHMALFTDLHHITKETLCGNTAIHKTSSDPSDLWSELLSNNHLLSPTMCWSLVSLLPTLYLCTGAAESKANLGSVVSPEGWHSLYSSNHHGLSMNRFQHHVFNYKGPTLLMTSFRDHVFCIAVDEEWRESSRRWGGATCSLIQLAPEFKVLLSGAGMLYLNTQDRSVPKCLQIGKDSRTMVISIDEGFSNISLYGVSYRLEAVEVWGCGGDAVKQKQKEQKDWEKKEAEKAKQRKLKLEDWKDNPDKQLLGMGGVQTEHAQR